MSEQEWNRQTVLILIKNYKSKPCLWNPEDKFFKVGSKKNEAWNEISASLGCDVDNIKKKMNSLLTSFRRERSREYKANYKIHRNKSTQKKKRKPKWYAFDHMSFLLSKFSTKDTQKIKKIEEPELIHAIEDERDDEDEEDVVEEIVDSTTKVVQQKEPQTTKKQNVASVAKRPKLDTPKVLEVISNDDTTPPKITVGNIDDCAIYGEHVACKLRRYSNHTKNVVQHYINNVLFKADMGKYDSGYDPLSQIGGEE